MLDGELLVGYIWWEGEPGWIVIAETNQWPPDTEVTTAWIVSNTGDEAAFFKVRFMDLESAGVLLNPGEEATAYLYPTIPGAGTYDYTLSVIADAQVVREYPVQVKTQTEVPGGLVLGIVVAGVLGLGALALVARGRRKPERLRA